MKIMHIPLISPGAIISSAQYAQEGRNISPVCSSRGNVKPYKVALVRKMCMKTLHEPEKNRKDSLFITGCSFRILFSVLFIYLVILGYP